MTMTRGSKLGALAAAVVVAASVAAPSAAHAWLRVGFGFVPFYVPAPYYVPPPVYYYGPPPVAYVPAPAPAVAPAAGPSCYAGAYVCPLDHASAVGSPCSCPTNNNGRIGGRVG
jgi:hypothetical protein